MANIYKSITELVGHTPLLEFVNLEKKNNLKAHILGKLEYFNPSGSVKDRAALLMLQAAEESGELKPGQTVVETTSGNTGIALAAFCAATGHPLIIYMEPGCTPERIQIMKAYGTDVKECFDVPGAKEVVAEFGFHPVKIMECVAKYAKEKDYYYVQQLFNENNPLAHYKTTGPELVEDTDGKIDIAVMLVGTAGTLAGVGSYLQEHIHGVKIVGVQPTPDSLSFVPDAKAKIDGVVIFDKPEGCTHPFVVRRNFKYDEVINVNGEDAYAVAREAAQAEGVFLGASAAAALTAAKELAARPENEGKNIVVILADNGMKYLSTNMYL
ncbi:MAG: cysteine synthase family protein [Clostridium sp.]|nr:cysteine synthase family protein [Clostridium sp.]MCM1208286.1 cysteine synthase family protein [Ruminococcus sp.]